MSSLPGPGVFGRGVVVRAGAPVPEAWAGAPRVLIDDAVLADPKELATLVDRLHRAWVGRAPHAIEWDIADDAVSALETTDLPPWDLDPAFLFPLERLRFLAFTNNYDARNGEPRWWWTVKAGKAGIEEGGPADGVTADGRPAWIDGGPRQRLAADDHATVHGETVELGSLDPVVVDARPSHAAMAADQTEAVDHEVGPARIIAPAGSGKTRTLVARLRHLVDDRRWPVEHLMVLAYNRRAADELVERLGVGTSLVRTIHSLGWAILQEWRAGLELIDEPELRNELHRLVRVPRRPNTDPLGPYLEALESVRIGLRDPEVVEAERDDVAGFAEAFDRLRERMYRRGRVDHGEQIYGAIEALLSDPELRARWQSRCRHLLVDEFQDLTPAYLLLIRLVASPQLDVFGVGDDDQVIYGYAGADPEFLIDFERLFPGAAEHALEVNYRCPPDVVEAATHLLEYNNRRIAKTITAGSGPRPAAGISVETGGDELAATAAGIVQGWIDQGLDPGDVAVLTRVNSSLIPVKAALAEQRIPTSDLLGTETLNRTTLRALFAWLRLALQPDAMGRSDLIEAIRRPSRGLTTLARDLITRRTLDLDQLVTIGTRLEGRQADRWDDFVGDLESLADVVGHGCSGDAVDHLLDRIGLSSSARTLDSSRTNAARSGHLDDLVAVRRAADLHPGLEDFEPWLREVVANPSARHGVTLSSVHRVKGMEWPRVIVFGADRGTMPHDLSTDREEERRVFHVAITRAIDHVTVLADRRRPSRYLQELTGAAEPEREPVRSTTTASRQTMAPQVGDLVTLRGGLRGVVAAVTGTALAVELGTGATVEAEIRDVQAVTRPGVSEVDGGIFEALRAWRREVSDRQGVPAYVVLHDRTLEEIAARKPATEQELSVISGIGPSKLENYGDEILAIVEASA